MSMDITFFDNIPLCSPQIEKKKKRSSQEELPPPLEYVPPPIYPKASGEYNQVGKKKKKKSSIKDIKKADVSLFRKKRENKISILSKSGTKMEVEI